MAVSVSFSTLGVSFAEFYLSSVTFVVETGILLESASCFPAIFRLPVENADSAIFAVLAKISVPRDF